MKFKTFVLSLLVCFLASCSSIKPKGVSKSGKKLFETFYLGDSGTQYFIKPLTFVNDNEEITIDFTFREKETNGSLNFTILSPTIVKKIDLFSIKNTITSTKHPIVKLLFNERKKELFVSRFSTKIKVNELKQLFNNNNWTLKADSKLFTLSKKSNKKKIDLLNNEIFSLF